MKVKNFISSAVLVIISVFFGCATNKGITETGMSVTAKGTSEGIVLLFNDIPQDIYSLQIGFFDITSNDIVNFEKDVPNTFVYINENNLDELKRKGNILCPFAVCGHEYSIVVSLVTISDLENNFENSNFAACTANAVAGGGIFLTNNPSLVFTNENRDVALSEIPTFSGKVEYSPKGLFRYLNFVIMEDGSNYGGGISHWNELTYPVRETLSKTQEHFGFNGDFPVNATVAGILMYNGIEWDVMVAKAEEEAIMSF